MSEFWKVVSNVSAICSIIGLPIAIFQIWKVQSTTKAMEQAIHTFLSLETVATLNKIFDTITTQKNILVSVYNNANKIGINLSKIKQDCENVIIEINICIYNLPGEYKIIEDLLVESTKCLNVYIDTDNAMKIRESGDCLYGAISELKKIKEKNRKFEIHTISKSN